MKGIIFNLLEDIVRQHHGMEVWEAMLDLSGASGIYTSLGNYSDEEIFDLVAAASRILDLPAEDVLRWFGRHAMVELSRRMPEMFNIHSSSRAFILNVNRAIHPEVRKLYSGADCPYFNFQDAPDGSLTMSYRSSRRLCHLAEGFIAGAEKIYCDSVKTRQDKCMHRGDDHCLFVLNWPKQAASAS
jgi:hypothetical protein